MREVIPDLTDAGKAMPETFADSPARIEMEGILLAYLGKVIRVRVTEVRKLTSPPARDQ